MSAKAGPSAFGYGPYWPGAPQFNKMDEYIPRMMIHLTDLTKSVQTCAQVDFIGPFLSSLTSTGKALQIIRFVNESVITGGRNPNIAIVEI